MAQKVVLKLDVHDQKDKKKAVKIVSGFAGIDSISMNMNDGKLTVVGLFDPVNLVEKLRKVFTTQIESVGPAKEEKDDNKSGRKDQKGYKIVPGDDYYYYYNQYLNYPPRPVPPTCYHDHHRSVEEDPNGCVIC